MPEKAPISSTVFAKFCARMEELGFTRIGPGEFVHDRKRYKLEAPPRIKRQGEGKEAGFRYEKNDLIVKGWTTYVPEHGPRDSDEGWVLITDKADTALDYSPPMRRTKYFLRRLYNWAKVQKERVDRRPYCPCCNEFMKVARGVGMKDRIWVCTNLRKHSHGRTETLHWNAKLSDESLTFLREEGRQGSVGGVPPKRKKSGKAQLKRKPWRIVDRDEPMPEQPPAGN